MRSKPVRLRSSRIKSQYKRRQKEHYGKRIMFFLLFRRAAPQNSGNDPRRHHSYNRMVYSSGFLQGYGAGSESDTVGNDDPLPVTDTCGFLTDRSLQGTRGKNPAKHSKGKKEKSGMPYRHNKERKVSVQHRYPDGKTEKEKGRVQTPKQRRRGILVRDKRPSRTENSIPPMSIWTDRRRAYFI